MFNMQLWNFHKADCLSCTWDSQPLLDDDDNGPVSTSSFTIDASSGSRQDNINNTQNTQSTRTPCFVYLLTALSVIGGFLFGYDTGVVSGAIILLQKDFHLSSLWQELVISITLVGAAVFAFLAGFINDGIGRKPTILISSVVFTLGSLVLAAASNKATLLIGRLILGVGIGLASMTVPMYIAENAPTHLRGRLVTLNNTFITFGQFIASVVDGAFSFDVQNGWRYMFGVAALPAVIQFTGFLFMPESARWLISRGKDEHAASALRRLRGIADVDSEISDLKSSISSHESANQGCLVILRVLKTPHVRRAFLVGCGLQLFQQICGINTVMYYSATIIRMSGVGSESTAIWLAVIPALVNFLFTFVGIYLVERLGRRQLIIGSLIGTIIGLVVLAIGFQLEDYQSPMVTLDETALNMSNACSGYRTCMQCTQDSLCGFCYDEYDSPTLNSSCLLAHEGRPSEQCANTSSTQPLHWTYSYCPTHLAWMATFGLVVYLASFAPGMGPMPWTINSEIYPLWARSTGVAYATTVNWVANLLISMTFLSLCEAITPYGAFWLYTGFAVIGLCFIWVFLPETKGKDLEEVTELFQQR